MLCLAHTCTKQCRHCIAGIRNWVAAKVSLDQDGSPRGTKDEDLPRGEPVTLFRSLRDGPRAVDQLLLAPRYWSTAHKLRSCTSSSCDQLLELKLNSRRHVVMCQQSLLVGQAKQCVLSWVSNLLCLSQIASLVCWLNVCEAVAVLFRGSVAVASDSFGRVLLIDVVSLTVIRIWKSYRDAQFGWIMCSWPQRALKQSHITEDHLLQSQTHAGKRRRADAESSHGMQDSNPELDKPVSLHLVLYAPRRQALELWQMRHGSRVATSQVSSTCKLLQRAVPFGLDPDSVNHTNATSRTSQCLILDTNTGQCMDVLAALQQPTHQTA